MKYFANCKNIKIQIRLQTYFDPIVYCKMALTTFVKQAAFGVLHNKRGGLMDAFNQAGKLKIENPT